MGELDSPPSPVVTERWGYGPGAEAEFTEVTPCGRVHADTTPRAHGREQSV